LLANLGATVVVLGNSGKAETAREYRGSSDIKAAVDMAYKLETISGNQGKLGKLALKCFKSRIAPGQNFGMEFVSGKGFVPFQLAQAILANNNTTATNESVDAAITKILADNQPGLNQKAIIKLARKLGFSRNKITVCLTKETWSKTPGSGNQTLYSLKVGAEGQEVVSEPDFDDVII
jgi:hypothetical protein